MAAVSTEQLRALADTDVTEPIPKEALFAAFQSPPFVYVPGTFNTRDLGGAASSAGAGVRPGFAFRSGDLSRLSPDGKMLLADKLGVKKVFDLRSINEHGDSPDPVVPGAENIWTPTDELDALVHLEDFVEGKGEKGYEIMYMDSLKVYAKNFKRVLEHVRDEPAQPFLFHCTAGRDRTGVLAGLLLALAGATRDAITLDFMLSRIGTEPAREQLIAFAKRGSGAEGLATPGFVNLCNLHPESWDGFARAVVRDYGGWDGYVTKTLGLSDGDLATIEKNLTAAAT